MDISPIFPAKLQKLWNALELRVLVLLSLFLQIVLIATGNRRKYNTRKRVAAMLWLSYLSADSVATLALGVLSQAGGDLKDVVDPRYTITALWAPFLLMHLGGPDTITAYALADNELWSRHLLGLSGQVFVAIYVFFRSYTGAYLNFLWIVIFFAGVVKYGERSWVLFSASKDQFRDSMVSRPDPGPNYAKFMDELVSREKEGYRVSLGKAIDNITSSTPIDPEANADQTTRDAILLRKAYDFFGTFKKLFADLILSFQDREISVSFFRELQWEDAFSIVEIELGLVFDLFYTKSPLVFSPTGFYLRLFTCSSTIAAFVAFLIIKKTDYPQTEVIITYFLFAGAIFLELYAILILFLTDRMMVSLGLDWTTRPHTELPKLVSLLRYLRILPATKRWSDSIGQYNVFQHCRKLMRKRTKGHSCTSTFDRFLLKFHQYLDKYLFWRSEPVGERLKKRIFDEVRNRAQADPKKLDSYWFDKILLKEMNFFSENDEVEFDQGLLLWHMATDICHHADQSKLAGGVKLQSEDCILLSNYMMHLLITSPFMLPSGIGQIRFQDTCAEASEFFNEMEISEQRAFDMLSRVDTRYTPSEVKGDRSKSLLFDAHRLAKSLNYLDVGQRWEKITQAWLDMLTFAAAQCSWSDHAEKLSQGGELLTHVWLLMAHFGMTDQFQISKGYIRAKLELK